MMTIDKTNGHQCYHAILQQMQQQIKTSKILSLQLDKICHKMVNINLIFAILYICLKCSDVIYNNRQASLLVSSRVSDFNCHVTQTIFVLSTQYQNTGWKTNRRFEVLELESFGTRGENVSHSSSESVSYTHLDVYKRQHFDIIVCNSLKY